MTSVTKVLGNTAAIGTSNNNVNSATLVRVVNTDTVISFR